MEWIVRLLPDIFTKKLLRSVVRYGLISLSTLLVANADAIPGLSQLADFISVNKEILADILGTILFGLVGFWSMAKNTNNQKVQKGISEEIK